MLFCAEPSGDLHAADGMMTPLSTTDTEGRS